MIYKFQTAKIKKEAANYDRLSEPKTKIYENLQRTMFKT